MFEQLFFGVHVEERLVFQQVILEEPLNKEYCSIRVFSSSTTFTWIVITFSSSARRVSVFIGWFSKPFIIDKDNNCGACCNQKANNWQNNSQSSTCWWITTTFTAGSTITISTTLISIVFSIEQSDRMIERNFCTIRTVHCNNTDNSQCRSRIDPIDSYRYLLVVDNRTD